MRSAIRLSTLAVLGVAVLAAAAWAVTSAGVSTGQPSGSQSAGAYTFTYTVSITGYNPDAQPPHKKFRDFHVYPRAGKELNNDSVTKPNGWKSRKASGGGVVFTKANGEGNGDFTFELKGNVAGDEKVKGLPGDVVVTSTGTVSRSDGDDIWSGERNVPMTIKSLTGTDFLGDITTNAWAGTYAAHLGQTATFSIYFDSSAMQYKVFDSITALDDWSDSLHLGLDSTARVPVDWGLTLSGLTGTLVDGEATMTVTVPQNAELLGRTFFLIATTQIDGMVQAKTCDIAVKIVQ